MGARRPLASGGLAADRCEDLLAREGRAPRMDACPEGGDHAPVPKQGGGRVCAKCGHDC